jgi:hypothetical protein
MRNLENWIDAFEEYTNILSSPPVFRRWAGISLIAAALERKTWVETSVGILYPNQYIFLVGPPAVGKTVLTSLVWRTMKSLRDHKVASSSVTRATVIQELQAAQRYVTMPEIGAVEYNSLFVCSNELGVLLPEYGMEMMSKLTDLYDCHPYSESRRNSKHDADIPRPQLNILAATQPGYLSGMLPEIAWEQGFLSRAILVYSDQIVRKSLFGKTITDAALWEKIITDLSYIGTMKGEFKFTAEVASLVDNFYMSGHSTTAPMHPKLQHYNTRRPAHLLKLMQIASAAESDNLIIDVPHFQSALNWLVEAESLMPEIFKAMNTGGDNSIMKDVWYYVFKAVATSDKPVPEGRIVAFLSQRVPAQKVGWILEVMKSAGLLQVEITAAGNCYRANGSPHD